MLHYRLLNQSEKIGVNNMSNRISIIYDRVRWEEKELFSAFEAKNIPFGKYDAKSLVLRSDDSDESIHSSFGSTLLQRCISHYRGMLIAHYLESKNCLVVNSSNTSRICGNKFLSTLQFEESDIKTPLTLFSFSDKSAEDSVEELGYPSVLKPIVGSWGRGVVKLNDKDSAKALIEMRYNDDGLFSKIFYIQQHINRPPRDIRTVVVGDEVVGAEYRYSSNDDWRTNFSLGAKVEECPITKDLEEIVLKASKSVGGGILGVDLMESDDGFLVHEINNNVEFKGVSKFTKENIAYKIVDYIDNISKR